MKACIAVPSLSTHGGAERVVCEQARLLEEYGWQTSILAADYDHTVLEDYNVPESTDILETDGGLIADVMRVREIIKNQHPDIFFTHSFTKRVYLGTRLFGDTTPYIPHIHGTVLWFVDEPNRIPHQRKPGYDELVSTVPGHGEFYTLSDTSTVTYTSAHVNEWLEGRALRAASRVLTGSQQVQRELRTLYGVDSTVVRPGVSQSWISQYESTEKFRLTDSKYSLLSVSRLDPRKRVDVLLEAVASLRANNYDVGLAIAGRGPEQDNLERLSKDLGITNAVSFAGFVPEQKLPSYYKSADVFACPGWMSYGITPLEAYAMRTPVGVSSDAFVQEVLSEEPGVEIIRPQAEAWTKVLPSLFSQDTSKLNISTIPTWKEYGDRLHNITLEVFNAH